MDLDLAGKTAIVTGASKGIGLAVTTALVAEGARVIAGSRSSSAGLVALGDAVRFVPVDLSTASAAKTLVAQATDGLDILVNNVGGLTSRTTGFLDVTDDDWLETLNLNLMAVVRTTRAAIPFLLERGGGTVVTVCSVNAFLPDPGVIDYSAAKAGVWNLSKSLSKEFGDRGIRFNTISPGPVSTALWLGPTGVAATVGKALGISPEEARRRALDAGSGTATDRFTEPAEVADLVLLLASSRAGNVTGADFRIDGGLTQEL